MLFYMFFFVQVIIEKWLLYDLFDGCYVLYYYEVEICLMFFSNKIIFYEIMYVLFFVDFLDFSQLLMFFFCVCGVIGYLVVIFEMRYMVNLLKIEFEMLEEIKLYGIVGFFKKLGLNDKEQ